MVRKRVEQNLGRYCAELVPPGVGDKIRMEYEIRGNMVTIIERRPPWSPELRPEWSRLTVAQLRYEDTKRALYWSDRNDRWHLYDLFEPTPDLSALLGEN